MAKDLAPDGSPPVRLKRGRVEVVANPAGQSPRGDEDLPIIGSSWFRFLLGNKRTGPVEFLATRVSSAPAAKEVQ